MVNELNFRNLTIKYNGNELSEQNIKKVKAAEALSVFVIIVLYIAAIIVDIFYLAERRFGLSIFVATILAIVIIYGGFFVCYVLIQKIAPRHYEFVNWLMRYKPDEIEVGWFNDRYLVRMYAQNWVNRDIGNFVDEDYLLYDEADKSRAIHMTIDLTKDDVEVIIENKRLVL